MNFIRRFILIILGLLGVLGLNWFYNPSIDNTDEYWDIQDEILDAELEADKIAERIEEKKNQETEPGKSFLDKVKDELEEE